MSAADRRSQALYGASEDSICVRGRPLLRASSSAAASERVNVEICTGCVADRQPMASAMVFSPRLPIWSRKRRRPPRWLSGALWQSTTVSRTTSSAPR